MLVRPMDSVIVASRSSFSRSTKNMAEVEKNRSVGVSASTSAALQRRQNLSVNSLFTSWPLLPNQMKKYIEPRTTSMKKKPPVPIKHKLTILILYLVISCFSFSTVQSRSNAYLVVIWNWNQVMAPSLIAYLSPVIMPSILIRPVTYMASNPSPVSLAV